MSLFCWVRAVGTRVTCLGSKDGEGSTKRRPSEHPWPGTELALCVQAGCPRTTPAGLMVAPMGARRGSSCIHTDSILPAASIPGHQLEQVPPGAKIIDDDRPRAATAPRREPGNWAEMLSSFPCRAGGGCEQSMRGTVRRAGSSRMANKQKHRSLEAAEGEGQLR